MCGIVGIFNYRDPTAPASRGLVEDMAALVSHRGPDDHGVHVDGPVGMGVRRLSVIDVAGGHQPISNEDGTIWTSYNGEIYNFRDLHSQLATRGHVFRTRSDTETIVHGYEEWGAECLQRFRGMFAFALWDGLTRTVVLARDRLGIKPLYYWDSGTKLVWGSEAKSILLDPDYVRRPNLSALRTFLRMRFVPSPATLFQGIEKLPPGHYLSCRAGQTPVVTRYWDVPFQAERAVHVNESDVAADVRGRLQESVKAHLVSEVPVGVFLSGGVDSSSVVALVAQTTNQPVQTFSVGFGPTDRGDELRFARQVACHVGTVHHELRVESSSFEALQDIIWHLDEPIADPAAIPTYLLSRFAREHVTVVLTGEGADELFGGYRKYYWNRMIARFRRLPESVRRAVIGSLHAVQFLGDGRLRQVAAWASVPDRVRLVDMMSDVSTSEVEELLTGDAAAALRSEDAWPFPFELPNGDDLVKQMLYLDVKTWLPDELLFKVDKMTMAASLEARVPFLDHEFVEFAMGLPSALKLKGDREKHVLREAISDLLPPDIVRRRKHVFMVPFDRWFQNELKTYLSDVVTDSRTIERGILNRSVVEGALRQFWDGRTRLGQSLFTLLVFELWSRIFLDGEGPGAVLMSNRGTHVSGSAQSTAGSHHHSVGPEPGRRS